MTEPARRPAIGDTVHYVSYGTPGGEYPRACRAAIVTETGTDPGPPGDAPPVVSLAVLNPTGIFLNRHIPPDPQAEYGGTWHWPE